MSATVATLPTDDEAMDAYSRTVSGVAEALAPSVANLRVHGRRRDGAEVAIGAGSAIVLSRDGFLLTSAHVVTGRRGGTRGGVASFTDGRETRFAVVGADPLTDLAVAAHGGPRPHARRRSATPSACASDSSWSRSATPTASPAP